jgi:hypothetical protein
MCEQQVQQALARLRQLGLFIEVMLARLIHRTQNIASFFQQHYPISGLFEQQ